MELASQEKVLATPLYALTTPTCANHTLKAFATPL